MEPPNSVGRCRDLWVKEYHLVVLVLDDAKDDGMMMAFLFWCVDAVSVGWMVHHGPSEGNCNNLYRFRIDINKNVLRIIDFYLIGSGILDLSPIHDPTPLASPKDFTENHSKIYHENDEDEDETKDQRPSKFATRPIAAFNLWKWSLPSNKYVSFPRKRNNHKNNKKGDSSSHGATTTTAVSCFYQFASFLIVVVLVGCLV